MNPLLDKYFTIVRKIIPDKPKSSAVGIDIGAGECKLVEIVKTQDKFELLSIGIEPVVDGNIKPIIQKLLSKVETPPKTIYTSLFGKGTLIRFVDMPRMTLDELKNSFELESDKYFPFPIDQIYTDCYIVDPAGKTKQMSVIVAAAKKEMADERVKLLTDLGMAPDFIGINSIALTNVINVLGYKDNKSTEKKPLDKNTATAILDMGESVSNLLILVDNFPRFTRDVYTGGRDLTRRISNALGVSMEEAEKIKRDPGEKLPELLNACETSIADMMQELKLSFDYFSTEKGFEVNKLLLTGGASMLQGIEGILEKNLEISVASWNPLESLKVSPKVNQDELKKRALKLGVALGLALYHYD